MSRLAPGGRLWLGLFAVLLAVVLLLQPTAAGLEAAVDTDLPDYVYDRHVHVASESRRSLPSTGLDQALLVERAFDVDVGRGYDDTANLARASARPAGFRVAPNTAVGFADDAVGSAYQGMRSGGGHAMRHLVDEGLIPNSGSLASRAAAFQDLTSPILRNPSATFNWRLGDTATRAFAGQAGGRQVVVFVAKEGPYQGRVVSAVVPDANQVAQWGL